MVYQAQGVSNLILNQHCLVTPTQHPPGARKLGENVTFALEQRAYKRHGGLVRLSPPNPGAPRSPGRWWKALPGKIAMGDGGDQRGFVEGIGSHQSPRNKSRDSFPESPLRPHVTVPRICFWLFGDSVSYNCAPGVGLSNETRCASQLRPRKASHPALSYQRVSVERCSRQARGVVLHMPEKNVPFRVQELGPASELPRVLLSRVSHVRLLSILYLEG